MKTCICGEGAQVTQPGCPVCDNNPVPEPARPSEGSVTCSDLVGELGAALWEIAELRDALEMKREHGMDGMSLEHQCQALERAHRAVSGVFNAMRPSSPNTEVSDRAGDGARS